MTAVNFEPATTYVVRFDFLGSSYGKTDVEAVEFCKLISGGYTENLLRFTNVFAVRTQVEKASGGSSIIATSFVLAPGPFTTQQFIKMMQFSKDISNSTWRDHMQSIQTSPLLASEKKKEAGSS